MNIATYNNVGITYLAAVVPNNEIDNYINSHFPLEHIRKIHENTGIRFRRHVSQGTCASDLAIRAAEIIFRTKKLDRKEIDFLLLVTQTPDFRMPFTASIVHHKLNLRPDSGALDINLGCSGFVYGLELAMALVASGAKQKVLLINAETRSKAYSIKDKTTGLLFGDAASAVVVERLEGAFCKMNCGTDGSGYDNIIIPGGGYRNPSDENSVKMVIFEDGSERSQEHGTMNGVKVFNFVIEKIPNVIKALIRESDVDEEGVSLFVLHQANNIPWIHARSATQFSWLVNISIGVLYPRRLRGRVLRSLSIFSSSLSVTVESGRDLGMYCRMSPFRFSFDPRCQLEYGSAK